MRALQGVRLRRLLHEVRLMLMQARLLLQLLLRDALLGKVVGSMGWVVGWEHGHSLITHRWRHMWILMQTASVAKHERAWLGCH